MADQLHPPHLFLLHQAWERVLERTARFAQRLAGIGTDTPLEAPVWAELAPERALREIARQAAAEFTTAMPGGRPR